MASINKITELIAGIKTIYSYYAKDTDIKVLVKTWDLLLKEYPDEVVEVAFLKSLQTCKVPPTPADVIERIKGIYERADQTDEELWSEFTTALHKTRTQVYRLQYPLINENPRDQIELIWSGLNDRLKEYIGSKGELMRLSKSYTDEELKYEKTRFLKTLPTIKKRKEYSEVTLIADSSKMMIEGGGR